MKNAPKGALCFVRLKGLYFAGHNYGHDNHPHD